MSWGEEISSLICFGRERRERTKEIAVNEVRSTGPESIECVASDDEQVCAKEINEHVTKGELSL